MTSPRTEPETLSVAIKPPADGVVPEWFHVLPFPDENGMVRGRDGREYRVDDPEAIIAATEFPIYLDRDHASMTFWGSTAASGWFDELDWREPAEGEPGGFYAHVEHLTTDGREDLEERRFRRLSPTILVERLQEDAGGSGEIREVRVVRAFLNVAMTNRPNLRLADLNRSEELTRNAGLEPSPVRDETNGRKTTMHESLRALAEQLGLGPGTSEEQVAAAVNAQLVPRAELEAARNRVKELEQLQAKAFADKVEEALNGALAAGKITPASVPFYRSACATPEGLKSFEQHVEAAPAIFADDRTHESDEPSQGGVLSAEENLVAEAMGLTNEQMIAAREIR